MELVWGQGGYVILFSTIPIFSVTLYSVVNYVKNPRKHHFIFIFCWFFLFLAGVMELIDVISEHDVILFANLSTLMLGLMIILLTDQISKTQMSRLNLSIWIGIIAFELGFFISLRLTGLLLFRDLFLKLYFVSLGYLGLLLMYYMGRVFKNRPKELFGPTLSVFMGSITIGLINPIIIGLRVIEILPGLNWVVNAAGTILIAYPYLKYPQIAFILPFKVLNLSVIHLESGNLLYNYYWDKASKKSKSNFFSNVMFAITKAMDEYIDRGLIREISMDNAVLTISSHEEKPVMAILVTSRRSQILRNALDTFCAAFGDSFPINSDSICRPDVFKDADKFIREYFSFIPFNNSFSKENVGPAL